MAVHLVAEDVLWLYVCGGHRRHSCLPAGPGATTCVPLGHIGTGLLGTQRVSSVVVLSSSAPKRSAREKKRWLSSWQNVRLLEQ